jgi:hypothetical protein
MITSACPASASIFRTASELPDSDARLVHAAGDDVGRAHAERAGHARRRRDPAG